MVADLTAMPLSNSSLLDEATAAAEAMTMCTAMGRNKKLKFLVSVGPGASAWQTCSRWLQSGEWHGRRFGWSHGACCPILCMPPAMHALLHIISVQAGGGQLAGAGALQIPVSQQHAAPSDVPGLG